MKVTQNKLTHLRSLLLSYETLCAIWYQLYNLENVEKKTPWRSVTFSEVAGFCIMGNIGRNLGKMLLGLVMATKQINKNIFFFCRYSDLAMYPPKSCVSSWWGSPYWCVIQAYG